MSPSTSNATTAAAPSPVQLTIGSFASIALVAGVLTRHQWGPLLETYFTALQLPSPVSQAVPIYVAVDVGQAYVLWVFNRFLSDVYHYRGADRPILAVIGVLCFDVIALLSLLMSHAPGFQVYSIPLGLYGLVLSYPQLEYFGLGVCLIAFGYSLLRAPDDLGGLLRPYAQSQIVTGALLAAPPLAGVWPFVAAAGHALMAVILFRASMSPTTRVAAARKR